VVSEVRDLLESVVDVILGVLDLAGDFERLEEELVVRLRGRAGAG